MHSFCRWLVFALLAAGLGWLEAAEEKSANEWMDAGVKAFFAADNEAAVAAFDEVVKLVPTAKPQLWQRGLALYYAERYQDGREQFETHQTVNRADVENAVWHFLCVSKLEGVEAARLALIPISGDSRVPMKEIYELFAGLGSVEAVMKAAAQASEENLKRNQLCYAHLYLGLFFEATGDLDQAKTHLMEAATIYEMDHYMGKTAITHCLVRGWMPKEKE